MPDLSKLKVCFIALTLGQGGAERQLYYLLKALKRSGTSLSLLTMSKGGFWETRIEELGVPVIWVGAQESRLLRLKSVISELRKDKPDILQSQHFFMNPYVAAAARVLGLREIGALRSDGTAAITLDGRLSGYLSLYMPRLIAVNSKIAIEQAMAKRVSPTRLKFLPNVVDTESFKVIERRHKACVNLAAVGRLVRVKRFDRFLSALAKLRMKTSTAIKGIIVGEGPLRGQLEAQRAELKLGPGEVEFRGAVADMAPVYEETDILVLTSDSEGTPNVVLEAMSSGVVVVAVRVGGVAEVIQDGETGFLVDPENEDALVNVLVDLINDGSLRARIGKQARDRAVECYSLQKLPVVLEDLYEVALQ